jgi:hypothetical protein
MYKEFDSLESLSQELEADKKWTGAESSLRNRYPIRFVLFENFRDFCDFIIVCENHNIYVQNIAKEITEGHDDKMITYSQLAEMFKSYIKSLPAHDYVITPFSEVARFYDNSNYHEFDSLLTTIRLIQSPEEAQRNRQRIYVPIIGMQGKVSKFKDDHSIHIWEYCSTKGSISYSLVLSPDTYGIRGLDKYYSVCSDFREWIMLWNKIGENVKRKIVCTSKCIYANAENAKSDNAFDPIPCHNVFEFMTNGLGLDFGTLNYSDEDLPYWEQIASRIDVSDFDFDIFVKNILGIPNLNDESAFVRVWFDHKDDFCRWLLKNYYVSNNGNTYLSKVLKLCKTHSSSDLFSLLATQVFDEPMNETAIAQRLRLLQEAAKYGVKITDDAEKKVKARLSAIAADPQKGYYTALKYMSPLTRSEQYLIIEWFTKGKIEKDNIQKLFPALYDYLSYPAMQLEESNVWIKEYFIEYSLSKVANRPSESLCRILKEHNSSQANFESWKNNFKTVKTLLYDRSDIDLFYWIDGLGVDWIPFVVKVIEKHKVDGVFLNEVYVATAALPTITSINKAKLEELSSEKLCKIGDIDEFAHKHKSYPEYIVDEFNKVEKIISGVLAQYNGKRIAFVSDHGISYMAQYGSGLNLAGIEANHAGRCAIWTNCNAVPDSNYSILGDGRTICSLNYNSLTTKTPRGQGAHGGCTPEEVLVPVIVVSGQQNPEKYDVKLLTESLDASNLVVRYSIRGLCGIETPLVECNSQTHLLRSIGNNVYESQPLPFSGNSLKVKLKIGTFSKSDTVSVNTGAKEDELF